MLFLYLFILVLTFLLCYAIVMFSPYICHKKVSISYKESFRRRTFYGDSAGTERISYITDNTEALLYRLNMIENAKTSIILSTFDFNADHAGKDILSALLQAADREVEVKVIVDGISGYLDLRNNPYFQVFAAHKNVSVKVYNPLDFFKPWRLPARLHDKYLIIDHKMYLLGGRNTMDLFLGNYSVKKNIDREAFVYEISTNNKSSINQLMAYFESVWTLRESKKYLCKEKQKFEDVLSWLKKHYKQLRNRYPHAYEKWDYMALTMPASKISLLSNPIQAKNKEPCLWYSLFEILKTCRQVTIFTPYIICGKEMYAQLHALTDQGVQAECITNDVASGANPWGCTDYLNQMRKIRETGIQVYEYMGTHSSHTKAVLADTRLSIIGSYNLDMRSTYQDTELMLAVDSAELNALIRKEAERNKTYSKTMGSQGRYEYGANYVPKKIPVSKSLIYGILRIAMIFLRRFL